METWKRILAKEWLIFLGCEVGTVVVLGGIALAVGTDMREPGEVVRPLLLIGLVIYGLIQLIRSVVWAVKTVRAEE